MTTAMATPPLTTSVFLFGEDQDTAQALAQALDEHGVLGSLDTALQLVSQAGRQAADSQLATVAHGLLDLDLVNLMVAGWRKQGELAAAAKRTAANPGSAEVVELASHRISSVHRPSVELLINDVHVATVNFELDIEFVVKALVVTVRNGHVVSLYSGACDVAATLAAEGLQLASRRAHFNLPLIIRLPLALHRGAGADPLPHGAKRPPTSSLSPRRRTLTNRSFRRQVRQRVASGLPGD
jgi:hypothetical protein